ncbi:MAG: FAD:protein FMN transferase [Steroidobacteraceae bacterium]
MRQVVIPTSLARAPALPPAGECLSLAGESMGTTWQVQVHAPALALEDLRTAIGETLALVVQQMSHWESGSDLSRFNAAAAGTDLVLPDPLFDLLTRAQRISFETGGAYDATAGELVQRWGFGPDRRRLDPGFRIPSDAELQALRGRSGWQRLSLDPASHTARQPGGLALDLSAIGKGFAVDLVSQRLLDAGFVSHLVEIGGELRGAGLKPDAQPWWVALEPPAENAALEQTLIALCDRAVATSGDYRRCFEQDGRRYSHTIDPRTGAPVDNDLASVTVISEECWHADALSTALTVMGMEQGRAFADRHDIAARFVRRTPSGLSEHRSRAWGDMLL